jgi:hypothetical protein
MPERLSPNYSEKNPLNMPRLFNLHPFSVQKWEHWLAEYKLRELAN